MKEADTSQVKWLEVSEKCMKHRMAPITPMGAECLQSIIAGRCAYVEYVENNENRSYFRERESDQKPAEVVSRGEVVEVSPDFL